MSEKCIVMDIYPSHQHSVDTKNQLKGVEYPSISTNILQLIMDPGVIAASKKLYKADLLGARVENVQCVERLRRQAEALKRPRGVMVGLAKGHQPHNLDAMGLVA